MLLIDPQMFANAFFLACGKPEGLIQRAETQQAGEEKCSGEDDRDSAQYAGDHASQAEHHQNQCDDSTQDAVNGTQILW